jgi:ubiquinone/menaquinone biosynthesis C-methylase UbiE
VTARQRVLAIPSVAKAAHVVGNLFFNDSLLRAATSYARSYYRWDTFRRWSAADTPEWFDHRADLYRFSELRRSYWAERGVYARELMHDGCRVLDLCCGDGFYTFHFYSEVASHIDACDWDPGAIAHASKVHRHPNVTYSQRNIIADPLPGAGYDVVVWDAAIEHFALADIDTVLDKVDAALARDGVLCGYTILNEGNRMHPDHLHEFGSAEELARVLRRTFPHVVTLETTYPDRHNIYFRASRTQQRVEGFSDPQVAEAVGGS